MRYNLVYDICVTIQYLKRDFNHTYQPELCESTWKHIYETESLFYFFLNFIDEKPHALSAKNHVNVFFN